MRNDWELDLQRIIDDVAPSLRSPEQLVVLLLCFRQSELGEPISAGLIAELSAIPIRTARRVLHELEVGGAIALDRGYRGQKIIGELPCRVTFQRLRDVEL